MSSTITTETDQMIDWHRELRAEMVRYIRAGMGPDTAKVAAVDAIDLRRDISGQSIRLVRTPAEPIEDINGAPLAVGAAIYDLTLFPVDDHGRIEPTWAEGGDR